MGDRWRNRLGYLVYDSSKIEVRTAEEQRCVDSAEEFLKGSFKNGGMASTFLKIYVRVMTQMKLHSNRYVY